MANYSKFLEIVGGVARTIDLSQPSNVLELGGAGLQMDGSTSGHIVIAASATTSTYSIVWPTAQAASSGYTLSNDGTGVLTWVPASSGSVTSISVNTTNGFAGSSSGGATPALTLSTTITGILQGNGTAISAVSTTGSGNVVLATSPTLVTPALGTPSALVGTNITGTASGLTAGNINATSNSTITTLSALSLPTSQLSGSISAAQMLALPTNDIYVGNGSNQPAAVAMSGDATIISSGALTLATVASAGTTGSSTSIPSITINAKGLVTSVTGNAVIAPAGTLSGTTLNSSVVTSSLTSLGTQASALNMGGNQISSLGSPSVSSDAANKGYVDAAINGLTWKGPVEAYAASNVPLTGSTPLVIDGYTVLDGNLLILGNQTTASENGEYSAAITGGTYTLTANGLPDAAGDAWLILNGTVYSNSAFVATSAVPTAAFIEFAGPNALVFTAPLVLTGNTVSITQSTTSTNGYLSSTDWNTFNNKQPAGNYITALTGDATASGPGSVALTLATVNSNVGSFGSSTSIPTFTVNAKGLITAASGNAVVAPAGTLTGTTLNSTVVSSSLTSVGTITSGTWNGTTIAIANGGTGQTTKQAAFDALSPLGVAGDTLYYNGTHNVALVIGSTGQVLTVVAGEPAWVAPTATSNGISTVETSDEALSANTLYALRYELAADAGTVGNVWRADYVTGSSDNFYVIGLAYPPSPVSIGGSVTVVEFGLINVPSHGFTTGAPLYLSAAGVCTSTAPSTAGQAVVKVGQVKDANNIWVDTQVMGVN